MDFGSFIRIELTWRASLLNRFLAARHESFGDMVYQCDSIVSTGILLNFLPALAAYLAYIFPHPQTGENGQCEVSAATGGKQRSGRVLGKTASLKYPK